MGDEWRTRHTKEKLGNAATLRQHKSAELAAVAGERERDRADKALRAKAARAALLPIARRVAEEVRRARHAVASATRAERDGYFVVVKRRDPDVTRHPYRCGSSGTRSPRRCGRRYTTDDSVSRTDLSS